MTRLTKAQRFTLYRDKDQDVLVDFDGTLCSWSYPDMGPPTDGARQAMKFLRREGFRVIVWSSRLSPEFNTPDEREQTRNDIADWMCQYDIPYDEIDTGGAGKRLGAVYIDDLAANFSGNWGVTLRQVLRLVELRKQRHEGANQVRRRN